MFEEVEAFFTGGCEGKTMNILIAVALIAALIVFTYYLYNTAKSLAPKSDEKFIATFPLVPIHPRVSGERFTDLQGRDVNAADLFMQAHSDLAPQKF